MSAGIRSGRKTEKSGTEKSATVLADIFLSQIFLFAGLSSGCLVSVCDSPAMPTRQFRRKSQTPFRTPAIESLPAAYQANPSAQTAVIKNT
jgi:hypothetical protein